MCPNVPISILFSFGKFFYCPNANEVEELERFSEEDSFPPVSFWMKHMSTNKAYFYNHIQYLYAMSTEDQCSDPPSKRILYLLSKVFARWHSTW